MTSGPLRHKASQLDLSGSIDIKLYYSETEFASIAAQRRGLALTLILTDVVLVISPAVPEENNRVVVCTNSGAPVVA